MATLYIFNPEHDLALASNLDNFTPPHAGRQLRHDLGFLPALWAEESGFVLVEDVENARNAFEELTHQAFAHFVDKTRLASLSIDHVIPWGWNRSLRHFLLRHGVDAGVMPSERDICVIRNLSNRRTSVALLKSLRYEGTVGESMIVHTVGDVAERLDYWGRVVLKAPWSSSGRGVRFVCQALDRPLEGWIRNILERQGSLIVEPYYNKVRDFAMEFESAGQGNILYRGLSLFHTTGSAYTGNVLASEEEKWKTVCNYIPESLLRSVCQGIIDTLNAMPGFEYVGPFGVDMMVVACDDEEKKFRLHPCVEINLRYTMGHVALCFPQSPDGQSRVMDIEFDGYNYKLTIHKQ